MESFKVLSKGTLSCPHRPPINVYASTTDDIRMFATCTKKNGDYGYSGYIYDIKKDEYIVQSQNDHTSKTLWEIL